MNALLSSLDSLEQILDQLIWVGGRLLLLIFFQHLPDILYSLVALLLHFVHEFVWQQHTRRILAFVPLLGGRVDPRRLCNGIQVQLGLFSLFDGHDLVDFGRGAGRELVGRDGSALLDSVDLLHLDLEVIFTTLEILTGLLDVSLVGLLQLLVSHEVGVSGLDGLDRLTVFIFILLGTLGILFELLGGALARRLWRRLRFHL